MELITTITLNGTSVVMRGGIEIEAQSDGAVVACHYPYRGEKRAYVLLAKKPAVLRVETE